MLILHPFILSYVFKKKKLAEGSAGYAFQHASIKATLDPRAEKIKGLYYRQADDALSPAVINLYASDIVELSQDFSAPSAVDVLAVTGKRNTKSFPIFLVSLLNFFSLFGKVVLLPFILKINSLRHGISSTTWSRPRTIL